MTTHNCPASQSIRIQNTILRFATTAFATGLLLLITLSVTACRTTEGMGRDVEHLGDNIADSADKHKP